MVSQFVLFIASSFSEIIYYSAIGFILSLIILHLVSKFRIRSRPLSLDSDSVVIITGGCMGIGKLMAVEIAELYNSNIIILDRRKDLFQEVSQEIKEHNGKCQCYYIDLCDNKSVDNFILIMKDSYKKIDFLLYNAGVFIPTKGWQILHQNHQLIMKVNYFTPIRMIKGLFPLLQGNHIAVVASMTSIMNGSKNLSPYMASKHAIYAYLNCMRQDLIAQKNTTTISIGCPYAINTTMFQGIKTKLDVILPVLDEKYVANRLVKEFISRKQIIYLQRRHAIIINFLKFLPTFVTDYMQVYLDDSNFQAKKIQNSKPKQE